MTTRTSPSSFNLTGQLLVAMPSMQDSCFSKAVILICCHSAEGCMGIILNHPLEIQADHLYEQLALNCAYPHQNQRAVHFGGPVQIERGFVLHHPATEFDSTLEVAHGIALTSSKDILEASSQDIAPQKLLIALGYSGWGAGQLETEIQSNSWLNIDLGSQELMQALVFNVCHHDKHAWAMQQLGLNYANLSGVAGHA